MFPVPSVGDLRIRSHVPRGLSIYRITSYVIADIRAEMIPAMWSGVYLGPLGRWLAPRTLTSVL
jgi:hypothetical protein